MSREIKFRAWNKQGDGGWIKEFLVSPDGDVLISNSDLESPTWESANEAYGWNVVLMGSTGLKDKSGKEIYKGDILKGTRDNISYGGPVVYFGCSFGIESPNKCWVHSIDNTTHEFEVIGNIYENPELLK